MDIRLPNITAPTAEGQIVQIKNYLFQLTNQLNFALKSTEDKIDTITQASKTSSKSKADEALDTFNSVKNLIIKSADIVDAYYEEMNIKLQGEYLAKGDFGEYKEKTDAEIRATSENLTQNYSSTKEIESLMAEISELRKDDCYIKTGWLDDNHTIAGVEIGRIATDEIGEANKAFARFTTDELVFYNDYNERLAWFAKNELHITNANITTIRQGGYRIDSSNGLAWIWVGRR